MTTLARVFNTTPGPLVVDEEGHTVDGYDTRDDVDVDGRTVDGRIAHALVEESLLVVVEDPPEPPADEPPAASADEASSSSKTTKKAARGRSATDEE